MRCGWAQHKVGESAAPVDAAVLDRSDPTNTNVYVGNLDVALTDSEIRRHFSSFGALAEMKLHRKGAYGFVRFRSHADAVRAIVGSNAQVCVVFGGEGGGRWCNETLVHVCDSGLRGEPQLPQTLGPHSSRSLPTPQMPASPTQPSTPFLP